MGEKLRSSLSCLSLLSPLICLAPGSTTWNRMNGQPYIQWARDLRSRRTMSSCGSYLRILPPLSPSPPWVRERIGGRLCSEPWCISRFSQPALGTPTPTPHAWLGPRVLDLPAGSPWPLEPGQASVDPVHPAISQPRQPAGTPCKRAQQLLPYGAEAGATSSGGLRTDGSSTDAGQASESRSTRALPCRHTDTVH